MRKMIDYNKCLALKLAIVACFILYADCKVKHDRPLYRALSTVKRDSHGNYKLKEFISKMKEIYDEQILKADNFFYLYCTDIERLKKGDVDLKSVKKNSTKPCKPGTPFDRRDVSLLATYLKGQRALRNAVISLYIDKNQTHLLDDVQLLSEKVKQMVKDEYAAYKKGIEVNTKDDELTPEEIGKLLGVINVGKSYPFHLGIMTVAATGKWGYQNLKEVKELITKKMKEFKDSLWKLIEGYSAIKEYAASDMEGLLFTTFDGFQSQVLKEARKRFKGKKTIGRAALKDKIDEVVEDRRKTVIKVIDSVNNGDLILTSKEKSDIVTKVFQTIDPFWSQFIEDSAKY